MHFFRWVTSVEPRKGIVEGVTAAARVAAEDPQIAFDFVGRRCLRTREEASHPSGASPRFRLHGAKSREGLIAALVRLRDNPAERTTFGPRPYAHRGAGLAKFHISL